MVGLGLGGFLSLITLATASSQIGFYYVTGAEMQFDSAGSVASDPAAVRLMMSGIVEVLISGAILLALSFLGNPFLYNKIGFWLAGIWKLLTPSNWNMLLPTVRTRPDRPNQRMVRIWPFLLLSGVFGLITLRLMRPALPYNHFSTTLPVSLLRVFGFGESDDKCPGASSLAERPFPLSDLVAEDHWESAKGNFKGWAPGSNSILAKEYRGHRPGWLMEDSPAGFFRWFNSTSTKNKSAHTCPSKGRSYYNPVADPLRVFNHDLDVYEPLREAFAKSNVVISNVVLILLESHRKDLFPILNGSNIHSQALETHPEEKREEMNKKIREMTPVAEQITGESFWGNQKGSPALEIPEGVWRDPSAPGMGGINVKGGLTGSSLSFKSVLGSHCGVFPLPVDMLEEVTTDIYQPCIPQILELFNRGKGSNKRGPPYANTTYTNSTSASREEVLQRPWKSAFIQSITDRYDRQVTLNTQMGFDEVVVRDNLDNKHSKYYPPSPELNYFGYPETDVKQPIRDMIEEAAKQKTRLFLSHMTSTTHHPWNVPDSFNKTEYMVGSDHKNLNKFMNTIRYVDKWVGDVLGMLEETGIANETLVVMLGDHGQAFDEDCGRQGTYKNGHISNFRIPIVFRHPHLPLINVEANATSMSVIPTLLDLLVQSKSLNPHDTTIASDLIHEYEGQSLLRPFRSVYKGRQSWNIGIINAGSDMLSVSSAASPYRVIVPLSSDFSYRFTNLETDPHEAHAIEAWSVKDLSKSISGKHGTNASEWVQEADKVARWWTKEMHRRWNYH